MSGRRCGSGNRGSCVGTRRARVVAWDVLQHLAGELRSFKKLLHRLQPLLLGLEFGPSFTGDQANAAAVGSEAAVSVVDPQMEAELGARREHAVGLVRALGNEVIDQDRGVCLGAVEDEWRLALHLQGAVDSSHDSLTRGLFVAGRSVDLAGEEES